MTRRNRNNSDTVSLLEAADQFGVSGSMAYKLAELGQPLTAGVPILRFGVEGGRRPTYRVSKAAIAATLGVDGQRDDDPDDEAGAQLLRRLGELAAEVAAIAAHLGQRRAN